MGIDICYLLYWTFVLVMVAEVFHTLVTSVLHWRQRWIMHKQLNIVIFRIHFYNTLLIFIAVCIVIFFNFFVSIWLSRIPFHEVIYMINKDLSTNICLKITLIFVVRHIYILLISKNKIHKLNILESYNHAPHISYYYLTFVWNTIHNF